MREQYIVGIDLGATQLRFIAARSKTGEIRKSGLEDKGKYFFPSPFKKKGEGVLIDNLLKKIPLHERVSLYLCEKLNISLRKLALKKNQVKGIGISVPGRVLPGNKFMGANTPFTYATKDRYGNYGIDVMGAIKREFKGIKIALDNDCNCAGLAQGLYYKSLSIDPYTTFYITISTGIGGGGPKRDLDEVGHIPIGGGFPGLVPRCGCGAYGCLEAYASGEGILNQALTILRLYKEDKRTFKQFEAYESMRLGKPLHLSDRILASPLRREYSIGGQLSTKLIFHKAALNTKGTEFDPFARYLIETAAVRTAKVIVAISYIHGVERIGIGGSVALENPKYIELISAEVDRIFWKRPNILQRNIKVELSPLGYYVNDYGALSLVLDQKDVDRWMATMKKLANTKNEK